MKEEFTDHVKTYCRMKPLQMHSDVPQTPVSSVSQRIFTQAKRSAESLQLDLLQASGLKNGKKLFRFRPAASSRVRAACTVDSDIFQVDGVFAEDASQEAVFESVVAPLLEPFLSGVNTCVCCYGQTGAGKTWTMSGGDTFESRGLIQRTMEELFNLVEMRHSDVNIFVSYMEIYNEVIYDLLGDTSDPETDLEAFPRVVLLEDETGTLHTKNLTLHAVTSTEQATDMFLFGNMNRIVSSTLMNQASSRSHCIFTIYCESSPSSSEPSALVRSSKFHLVDLAGSERVHKTGLSETNLREARYINKSLHFLEQVMHALYQKKTHIPYRNSVLTSVLRESLGGNCRTVLIGNVSMESINLRESVSTCRFVERCGQIERKIYANIERIPPVTVQAKLESFPLKPGNGQSFCFLGDSDSMTVRALQELCGSNLSQFPKELRKQMIEKIRDQGMEYKVSCVGDLCALVQVLIAKLTQSDLEKQELRNKVKELPALPVSLSPVVEWSKSQADLISPHN